MKIQNYKDFSVVDFVEDEDFRVWVLSKGRTHDLFWRTYLTNYPEQKVVVEEAKELLINMSQSFQTEMSELTIPKDDFVKQLKESFNTEHIKESKPKIRRKPLIKYYMSAAAAVMLICIFYFSYASFSQFEKIEYVTGNGEWKEITLPDGSKAELNANSQLSILNDWENGDDRQVWLKGEAFFEVEKKPATGAKFYVATKDLKVEVLGTMFNVNTRNERTEVFLEEGKVVLNLDDDKKEEIVPGEFIAYSQSEKKIIDRYKKKSDIHSDWKKGVLKIDDASIKEILKELETIYGIDIIANDIKLLEKEGSIAVPVDDLEMAVSILERILGVKVKSNGKQYHIE